MKADIPWHFVQGKIHYQFLQVVSGFPMGENPCSLINHITVDVLWETVPKTMTALEPMFLITTPVSAEEDLTKHG